MKPKELRRLMTWLVGASGTMSVLVAGGCSGSVTDPETSSAGSASGGSVISMAGTSSAAGSCSAGSAMGGTSALGGTSASGAAAGTAAGGVLGCAGAECAPSAGTSWCGDTGGYGGCAPATSGGCGGTSSCECIGPEPEPGPCTIAKNDFPVWKGTLPRSCLPADLPPSAASCRELCGSGCPTSFSPSCTIVETTAETATVSCRVFFSGG